ncbi:DUF171-domain-containing protein [Lindgomyces ingoldianus]|uniref:DUF171-domain-containing protein n=1 Tax=Lindgomyces ingoldianus TaxID=673940 RepID=A0ACB6RFK1_9PLEO|nr:DUF171-domain-containing protein [Lindgomyces ingoldianus]KAF2477267.1 DUF171-domain-containing protein [Lindgomyces ingoldianus]
MRKGEKYRPESPHEGLSKDVIGSVKKGRSKKTESMVVDVDVDARDESLDTIVQTSDDDGLKPPALKKKRRGKETGDTSDHGAAVVMQADNGGVRASRKGVKDVYAKQKEMHTEIEVESDGVDEDWPAKSRRVKIAPGGVVENKVVELDTSKPSAVFKPKKGRPWTLSIAVPGSFIANVLNFDQKNSLAGRIARAAAVFCVDEIIVFDDDPSTLPSQKLAQKKHRNKSKPEILAEVLPDQEPWDNPDQFLFHLLSYMECPPHLRRRLFPQHANLRGAGSLPSLDMPHHHRPDEWCEYREGVTIQAHEAEELASRHSASVSEYASPARPAKLHKKPPPKKKPAKDQEFSFVDCGLGLPLKLPYTIPPNNRVTLKFSNPDPPPGWPHLTQETVDGLEFDYTLPSVPREEAGYYWGYTARRAESLSAVYTECPFDSGYDFSIGTSERGVPLSSIIPKPHPSSSSPTSSSKSKFNPEESSAHTTSLPSQFQHLLLVFGGVHGLEPAVANDPVLKMKGLTKETANEAFDAWVDLVPGQGSRTIRTEEAVLLGLMGIRGYVERIDI